MQNDGDNMISHTIVYLLDKPWAIDLPAFYVPPTRILSRGQRNSPGTEKAPHPCLCLPLGQATSPIPSHLTSSIPTSILIQTRQQPVSPRPVPCRLLVAQIMS